MSRYTPDGGVISSKTPISRKTGKEHYQLFGLYKGTVIRTVYPQDAENFSKERVEYVVKVRGQEFPRAINMRDLGGIFNYQEVIRKHSEKDFTRQFGTNSAYENLDGESIYVLFLEGNADFPIIVGAAQHGRQYKKSQKKDGVHSSTEFNGVEFFIDKEGNFTTKCVGQKNVEGKTVNPESVGSMMKLTKNGTIQFTSSTGSHIIIDNAAGNEAIHLLHKTGALAQIDKDGSIKLVGKDGAYLFMNAVTGETSLVSKDGAIVGFKNSGVTISSKSGKQIVDIKNDGKIQVTADSDVILSCPKATLDAGTSNIGNNAFFSAVLAETLKAVFDAHIHATAVGPSGPPLPPNTIALADATPLTAVTASFVKLKGNLL